MNDGERIMAIAKIAYRFNRKINLVKIIVYYETY